MSLNNLKFMFLLSLIYSSFVGWSSNSWLVIWFMMEISFLFFVGFVLIDVSYGIVELMVKYFISQVFISLMFSGFMVVYLFNLSYCLNLCFVVILFMKLGLFPFHSWVIMILGKLNWFSFVLLSVVLKLLPILLIYYLNILSGFSFALLFSAIAGSVFGLGNMMIQKLLGYSSIVHLCWVLLSLMISVKAFLIYFFCYSIMMVVFSYIFNLMNIFYINQFKLFASDIYIKFLVFFLTLSFAGFPPFMGFLIKWLVVNFMLYLNLKTLVFFMMLFSLFSVLFYLELFFYFMMISSLMISWHSQCFSGMLKLIILIFAGYFFIYFFI